MNSIKIINLVVLAILLLPFFSVAGDVVEYSENESAQTPKQIYKPTSVGVPDGTVAGGTRNKILFNPPFRGVPVDRVAGGTRGIEGGGLPGLDVITTNYTGLTFQEQPSLYYFLNTTVEHPIELTIIKDDDDAIDPILETRIATPKMPGIHSIHLADFDFHLQKNISYQWYLSIIPDPDRRSKDILASGRIERIECPDDLQRRIEQSDAPSLPHIYAEAGIWYDAFSEISNLIETDPRNPLWRKQRASLLEQVELGQVAQFEMEKIADF